ncbi:MAG TPA: nucleotidyltransferase domain-containing protein [Terriglobales bacterium]|nr:nucleotidyltransferase domain-containing protein [Terriglobales bacterium]
MSGLKDRLDEFVARIRSAAGENLQSVIVYGSAASGELPDKYSDINLLCVLNSGSAAELKKIAPVVKWWSSTFRDKPPLFVTLHELRTSADVFAIEMLDAKSNHRVLHGQDPLPAIDVQMNLHRIEVEHELRTMLLRLRQQYLLTPEDEGLLEQVLAKSLSSVLALLRHAMIAVGRSAPNSRQETVTMTREVFGADVSALQSVLDLREGRRPQADVTDLYRVYMDCLITVIERIDKAVPLSQWRRVETSR